ncbi:cell division inhibitor SulA [Agarilytica rhodophyticola]|uniref:cell division inhibitor SulA n=1 Tax=Agarilytica rhodophyticola TaxID=1737490 RepID=UPI000B345F57|nr:SulA-like leucine-rich domain-containing protein [Agarilytica rhodophyticola]
MLQAHKQETAQENIGITEVVLPGNDIESHAMVLPMIAYLSHQNQDKWLTWIAPQNISKAILKQYDFANHNIRLIHPHDHEEGLRIFCNALVNGNSNTVIGSLDFFTEKDRATLELASRHGHTRGIVLRTRNSSE